MNALKEKVLKVTADLLLGREARPSNGNLSSVKSLEQCVAYVLESRAGLKPVHVISCHLKDEEREIFPEVVWDLLCARVIVPTSEAGGLDKIRPHSDAEINWGKLKVSAGISG